MAHAYPAAIAATSSQTSGWGAQAGKATSASTMPLRRQDRAREHEQDDPVDEAGEDDAAHERAPEEAVVLLHVHVPRRDQIELDRGHRRERDDQDVGVDVTF